MFGIWDLRHQSGWLRSRILFTAIEWCNIQKLHIPQIDADCSSDSSARGANMSSEGF